jgi:glycosyltransferase involved in cell wall biosynthesis
VARSPFELLQAARETIGRLIAFAPDVIMLHGFNATILGYALRSLLPPDLPIVATYHGKYFARSSVSIVKAAIYNWLERHFFSAYASAVIAVSHHSAAELEASGVPRGKIVVLHNAVALGCPPIVPKVHNDADGRCRPVRLITVSRLVPEKGIDVLLRAFAAIADHHPATTLDVVGDGPLRGELARLAESLSISGAVRFLGQRQDVAELLADADIYVMTSRQENHSVSILEAMRTGLPLVVTDVGGNAESVRNWQDGFLVPDLDERATALALSRLITSGSLRARFGQTARERFEGDFECTVMIDRLLALLRPLARNRLPEGA